MINFKIDNTDVILQDYEKGKGKIIISDSFYGSYSAQWNAMGSTISDFIKRINTEYFANNLNIESQEFCSKRTVLNIKEHLSTEIVDSFTENTFNKISEELEEAFSELENAETINEFVDRCYIFVKDLNFLNLNIKEEKEMRSLLTPLFEEEPWHYEATIESNIYKWLKTLHVEIIKKLD